MPTRRHPSTHDRPRRPRRSGRVRAGLGLAAFGTVLVLGTQGTSAYWTDQASMQTGSVSATTIASQTAPTCGAVVLTNNIQLTWPQVNSRYEYTWNLYATGNLTTSLANGVVGSGTAVNGTVSLVLTPSTYATNGNYTVVVRARLTSPTSWTAATTTSTLVRRGTGLGATMYCGNA